MGHEQRMGQEQGMGQEQEEEESNTTSDTRQISPGQPPPPYTYTQSPPASVQM